MTPTEFKLMVKKIRVIEKSLGNKNVFPTKIEEKIKNFIIEQSLQVKLSLKIKN